MWDQSSKKLEWLRSSKFGQKVVNAEYTIEIQISCQFREFDQRVKMVSKPFFSRELVIEKNREVEFALRSHDEWHPIPTSGYVRVP